MELADLWLFDLKLMDDSRHLEYTGVSNELALKNLETLALAGKGIIIRFPLIPGITDGKDNLEAIAKLMSKLRLKRIDILPYHAITRDKYRRIGKAFLMEGAEEPAAELVEGTVKYFIANGLDVRMSG
jgi:pyruvate formate lyase activating enzyme